MSTLCAAVHLYRDKHATQTQFSRSDGLEASITTGDTPSHWHEIDFTLGKKTALSYIPNAWGRPFGVRTRTTCTTFFMCQINPIEMIQKPLSDLFNSMHHGKYDFADFMQGRVDENYKVLSLNTSGNHRKVFHPNKKLKVYHTFLNLFLFECLPINKEVVYSYRKGFSAYHAVSKHSSSKHFFQTDTLSSLFSAACTGKNWSW